MAGGAVGERLREARLSSAPMPVDGAVDGREGRSCVCEGVVVGCGMDGVDYNVDKMSRPAVSVWRALLAL